MSIVSQHNWRGGKLQDGTKMNNLISSSQPPTAFLGSNSGHRIFLYSSRTILSVSSEEQRLQAVLSLQQRAGSGTKGRGRACAERPRGAWPRAPPPARRADVAVTSRRSCHGGAERPGVGAGVVQGSGPPGEAGAERGRRSALGQSSETGKLRPERGRGRSGSPPRRGRV